MLLVFNMYGLVAEKVVFTSFFVILKFSQRQIKKLDSHVIFLANFEYTKSLTAILTKPNYYKTTGIKYK